MNYELTTRSWYTAVLVSPGAVRDETKNGFVADSEQTSITVSLEMYGSCVEIAC